MDEEETQGALLRYGRYTPSLPRDGGHRRPDNIASVGDEPLGMDGRGSSGVWRRNYESESVSFVAWAGRADRRRGGRLAAGGALGALSAGSEGAGGVVGTAGSGSRGGILPSGSSAVPEVGAAFGFEPFPAVGGVGAWWSMGSGEERGAAGGGWGPGGSPKGGGGGAAAAAADGVGEAAFGACA